MEDNELRELLEDECASLIEEIRDAAPDTSVKVELYKLQTYHKMLIEEKKIDLEMSKLINEKALKGREIDFKVQSAEAERKLKEDELDIRRESNHDDYYFKDCDTKLKESDQELKKAQAKEEKKNRIINWILTGAGIIIPVFSAGYWMAKGMRFEETGTFTSRTGQWIGNHFKLFKCKNG